MDPSKIKIVKLDAAGRVVTPSPKVSTLPLDLPPKPKKDMRIVKVTLGGVKRVNRSQLAPNGHWMFDKEMCQGKKFGFIYLIHDTLNNRMYIGKKQFYGTGSANRGQPTNWKTYTSSCDALQAVIKAHGKEHFKFYVLDEYEIRGSLGFAETWSLMHVEAPCHRDKWYNMLVNKVSWYVKEPISKKHKERLGAIISGRADELFVWSEEDA